MALQKDAMKFMKRPPKAKVILRKKNRQYLEMQIKTTMRDYLILV